MQGHDIVVIGSSMGGLESLRRIVKDVPSDWKGVMLIVQHVAPYDTFLLDQLLKRLAKIPVVKPTDNETIMPGRIYVAPANVHMLVKGNKIMLTKGPRENYTRPAIDPLFRSAAAEYGSRVIGIILSGILFDGASGLRAVKRCGGITIIQDPSEALSPEMPLAAKEVVAIDYTLKTADMVPAILRLAEEEAVASGPVPEDIKTEVKISESLGEYAQTNEKLGKLSSYSCPECGGALWETKNGLSAEFRCHLGHTLTLNALDQGQRQNLEKAFITALRVMEERINFLRRLQKTSANFSRYEEDIQQLDEYAGVLRNFLMQTRLSDQPV
jgi:two-component system chemotaxis response regulator CheB